jgi:hypothetical protein
MPLFRQRAAGPGRRFPSMLPPDIDRQLQAHGHFAWKPQSSPLTPLRIDRMYTLAQADRDGFLRELRSVVDRSGGWVALGGKYVVTDILPIETDTDDFNAIVLAGYQFLRNNGVPPRYLSPNDHTLWERVNSRNEPWLLWRDPPSDPPTPLRAGEERKVAEILRSDGYTNTIIVRQVSPTAFTAVVEGAWSEDDPRITRSDWYTCPTLHDLYVRIGEGHQTPTDWAAPELQRYFPLPPMTI